MNKTLSSFGVTQYSHIELETSIVPQWEWQLKMQDYEGLQYSLTVQTPPGLSSLIEYMSVHHPQQLSLI